MVLEQDLPSGSTHEDWSSGAGVSRFVLCAVVIVMALAAAGRGFWLSGGDGQTSARSPRAQPLFLAASPAVAPPGSRALPLVPISPAYTLPPTASHLLPLPLPVSTPIRSPVRVQVAPRNITSPAKLTRSDTAASAEKSTTPDQSASSDHTKGKSSGKSKKRKSH